MDKGEEIHRSRDSSPDRRYEATEQGRVSRVQSTDVDTRRRDWLADLLILSEAEAAGDTSVTRALMDSLGDYETELDAEVAHALDIESRATFEVVLRRGDGEDDHRLCFECDRVADEVLEGDRLVPSGFIYEIRRIFFRRAHLEPAEKELSGESWRVAEEFGRRMIPELAD